MNMDLSDHDSTRKVNLVRAADPRLVLLHRSHARLILFENGLMTLDEAVFGLLVDYCPCTRRPA
jgi:hypothetical protein